jgi:hypothetical protein
MYFSPVALLAHFTRIPWLLVLIIAALTFSAFNWNDNHEFRTVPGSTAADGTMYFQEDLSLEKWLKAREKIDLYNYDHYPVFIVAAEGGGLRSAYFTNRVLMTLQTICPYFALHTIAISGVSGGSVGAASFVAQVKDRIRPPKARPGRPQPPCKLALPKNPATSGDDLKMYGEDHLAALLAGTLFPDAAQRLLWWPVEEFDRARAIECSFEMGLARSKIYIGDPCSNGSLRLGDVYPGDTSEILAPYLFLNTTSVTTGAPLPITTRCVGFPRIKLSAASQTSSSVLSMLNGDFQGEFEFTGSDPCDELPDWQKKLEKPSNNPKDVPLSTAAFLSARFPFILPPARFLTPPISPEFVTSERLLDGGIFEASGTWFAEQIARKLLKEIRSKAAFKASDASPKEGGAIRGAMDRVQIHILVISSTPCVDRDWPDRNQYALFKGLALSLGECFSNLVPPTTLSGFAELGSPPSALLNARVARGYEAPNGLRKLAQEHRNQVSVTEIRFLNSENVHIPLSWSMSRASRRLMDTAAAKIAPDQWSPPQRSFQQEGAIRRQEKVWLANRGTKRGFKIKQTHLCVIRDLYKVKGVRTDPLKEDCEDEPPSAATPPPEPLPTGKDIVIDDGDHRKDPLPAIPEVDHCEGCKPKER